MSMMKRGDFVQTLFDTGARGYDTLYGQVTKAGPATYTVMWESGLSNRIQQGYREVQIAKDMQAAESAMYKVATFPR